MPRDTRRTGLGLAFAGLLGAGFFLLTDPRWGIAGDAAQSQFVDAVRSASLGTWVGVVGAGAIALIGVWLMTRRTV